MCNPINHEREFMRLCASQLHASPYLKLPRRELFDVSPSHYRRQAEETRDRMFYENASNAPYALRGLV